MTIALQYGEGRGKTVLADLFENKICIPTGNIRETK